MKAWYSGSALADPNFLCYRTSVMSPVVSIYAVHDSWRHYPHLSFPSVPISIIRTSVSHALTRTVLAAILLLWKAISVSASSWSAWRWSGLFTVIFCSSFGGYWKHSPPLEAYSVLSFENDPVVILPPFSHRKLPNSFLNIPLFRRVCHYCFIDWSGPVIA